MLTIIVNYIIKFLMVLIDTILQLIMILSLPLILLIAEGNSVKFHQYYKIKDSFLLRFLSKIKYILWGSIGLCIIIYVVFVYNSIYIYTTKIFDFSITKSIYYFIILVTVIVSLIYYTLVISLQRKVINRKIGSISVLTNIFLIVFIIFFVSILSYPYQLNKKKFILSEIITGYNKINLILEFKIPILHDEYIILILKNTIIFSLALIIKISLMYLDSIYLKNKKKEITNILSIKQI